MALLASLARRVPNQRKAPMLFWCCLVMQKTES